MRSGVAAAVLHVSIAALVIPVIICSIGLYYHGSFRIGPAIAYLVVSQLGAQMFGLPLSLLYRKFLIHSPLAFIGGGIASSMALLLIFHALDWTIFLGDAPANWFGGWRFLAMFLVCGSCTGGLLYLLERHRGVA